MKNNNNNVRRTIFPSSYNNNNSNIINTRIQKFSNRRNDESVNLPKKIFFKQRHKENHFNDLPPRIRNDQEKRSKPILPFVVDNNYDNNRFVKKEKKMDEESKIEFEIYTLIKKGKLEEVKKKYEKLNPDNKDKLMRHHQGDSEFPYLFRFNYMLGWVHYCAIFEQLDLLNFFFVTAKVRIDKSYFYCPTFSNDTNESKWSKCGNAMNIAVELNKIESIRILLRYGISFEKEEILRLKISDDARKIIERFSIPDEFRYLNKRLTSKRRELKYTQEEMKKMENNNVNLKKKLEKLQMMIKADWVEETNTKIKNQEEQIKNFKKELQKLEKNIATNDSKKEKQKYFEILRKLESLRKENKFLKEKKASLERESMRMRKKIREDEIINSKKNSRSKEKISSLEKALNEERSISRIREEEYQKNLQKLSQPRNDLIQKQKETELLKEKLRKMEKELKIIKRKNSSLEANFLNTQNELSIYKGECDTLRREKESYQKEGEELKKKEKNFLGRIEELEKEVKILGKRKKERKREEEKKRNPFQKRKFDKKDIFFLT